MRPEERHQAILEMLGARGRVEVDELVRVLGTSAMTVRRDLASLESGGSLRRVYRGAEPQQSGSYEPPFAVRAKLNVEGKRRMARLVRSCVKPGQTVIVDGGSTGVAIAEAVCDLAITVATHSMRVANVLLGSASVRLMVSGGIVRPNEQTLVGPSALRMFEDYRFDTFLMTASGAHAKYGLSEWNAQDAEVKRAALQAAERCIASVEVSKFGRPAFARVAEWDAVDELVVDDHLDDDTRQQLESRGVEVHLATGAPS
jgi:DeoR/GlpR family transcriptional regulator of sugar metabolism